MSVGQVGNTFCPLPFGSVFAVLPVGYYPYQTSPYCRTPTAAACCVPQVSSWLWVQASLWAALLTWQPGGGPWAPCTCWLYSPTSSLCFYQVWIHLTAVCRRLSNNPHVLFLTPPSHVSFIKGSLFNQCLIVGCFNQQKSRDNYFTIAKYYKLKSVVPHPLREVIQIASRDASKQVFSISRYHTACAQTPKRFVFLWRKSQLYPLHMEIQNSAIWSAVFNFTGVHKDQEVCLNSHVNCVFFSFMLLWFKTENPLKETQTSVHTLGSVAAEHGFI